MIEILGPVLAIALAADVADTHVAIILRDKTVIMERAEAQLRYNRLQREDDPALFAALEIALGSIPDQCTVQQEDAGLCLRPNPTE